MPWRLDSITRTDDIVAAVHGLVAEGGISAVSYRAIAAQVRISHSTLHHHYPDRKHLFRVVAHRMARYRFNHLLDAVRQNGLTGMLPTTPEDARDCVVWLALLDLARTEPTLCHTINEAQTNERHLVDSALEGAGVPVERAMEIAEPLRLLVTGLEGAMTMAENPMSLDRATSILTAVVSALSEG